MSPDLEERAINAVRFLAVDAIQRAHSGHPGLPLGAAPMAYVLWTRHLRHNPANPNWPNRDRFVLSAGHGSMLLYALLYLTGYNLTLDDIQAFRQWNSRTPGHPEFGCTPGVEATTGPLGQGLGNAVGMAIAEAHLAARFNRPGHTIVDHYTYVLVSDGDLMEGIAAEAISLAGHLGLGKLIVLYDDNRISLAGSTALTFTEDVAGRFRACGWHVRRVEEGNDLEAIDQAIRLARNEMTRPSLILVRTTIGYGAPHKEGTFHAHGEPLGEEEVRATKERLGWPLEPAFYVPPDVLEYFRQAREQGARREAEWTAAFARYRAAYPDLAAEFARRMAGDLPPCWEKAIPPLAPEDVDLEAASFAPRKVSEGVLQRLAAAVPELLGGSADLNPSCRTWLKGCGDLQRPGTRPAGEVQGEVGGGWDYGGRNLHFGVREHAMGAIANGLALHGGIRPYAATFFIFSDYMRPSLRLAALMGLPVVYIFTHDSIGVGEDGPTHQPVEQLMSLRAVPNLTVIRPADPAEIVEAWRVALRNRSGPTAIVLSRQNLPLLDRRETASAEGLRRGGYLLWESPESLRLILLATGSEVYLALQAGRELAGRGIGVRVVSLPSWELFDRQPRLYREAILPPTVRARVAVEAGIRLGWERYVGLDGAVVGLDTFGAGAPGHVLMEQFGITVERVRQAAEALLEATHRLCRRRSR